MVFHAYNSVCARESNKTEFFFPLPFPLYNLQGVKWSMTRMAVGNELMNYTTESQKRIQKEVEKAQARWTI